MYKRRGEYSELVNVICSRACRNVTYFCSVIELEDFAGGSAVKNPSAMQETLIRSLGQADPLEEGMTTTPVFLPGESHGQRSLVGYSL